MHFKIQFHDLFVFNGELRHIIFWRIKVWSSQALHVNIGSQRASVTKQYLNSGGEDINIPPNHPI